MSSVHDKDNIEALRAKARELVSQMTLEEKVSQTLSWAKGIDRLDIIAYNWWNEALHGVARAGVATVFPQAITLAGSFDEDLVYEVADTISTEGRAKYNNQQKYSDTDIYKGLTFWSPNVNIFRDPRWGRGHETYGEDPYLTSRLGVSFVKGIQQETDGVMKAAACAKHFAVHSGPEDIRHSFNAEVSQQDLRETYLPAFETCVKEGKVEAVMGAYNRTNGEPCCGSKTLLKDILRDEWGFTGHVTSDCWAIKDFHEGHRVTHSAVESVALAMNNGCDLNCGNLFTSLVDAVEQGLVDESRIDEAVVNLYVSRMKLGVLGTPKHTAYDDITLMDCDTAKSKALNLKAAKRSLVLLKNDGLLPLKKEAVKTIGIIGPNANNRKALVGNYEGTSSEYVTVLEGVRKFVGEDVRILYSEGCHLHKDRVENLGVANDRIAEVKGICENSDVIVLCMGLDAGLEGEEGDQGNAYASGDKPNLDLPGIQQTIIDTAAEFNKPVVLVVLSGSALAIGKASDEVNAVLYAGYPGAQGGNAVAEILFGAASPEGKLPITFYKTTEELPEFTDYSMKGRTYRYMTQDALYPFGFGLNYADVKLNNVSVNTTKITKDGVDVTVELTNDSQYETAETVQLYIKAERANTPNASLKGLKKVRLLPGESKEVKLHLTFDSFGLYDEEGKLVVGQGDYTLYVGKSQPDKVSVSLMGQAPVAVRLTV